MTITESDPFGNRPGGRTPLARARQPPAPLHAWRPALHDLGDVGSLWFANESNAGKFWDRLPHLFDFIGMLVPRDGWEVWRALFDLPSPYDDGSLKYDYPEGRMYLTSTLYVPEYIYKMLETINIALVSTLLGFAFGFVLCFLAASNMVTQRWLRFFVRRFLEILRAFPEIVIAGFFLAVLSLGPIPAIIAVSIHTVGALGKMFFEVVENADMRPTRACAPPAPTGSSGSGSASSRR